MDRELFNLLVNYGIHLGLSLHDAEDAAQDTLVILLKSSDKFGKVENLKALSKRILELEVKNSTKKSRRRLRALTLLPGWMLRLEELDGELVDTYSHEAVVEKVHRIIELLEAKQRVITRLRYVDGLTESRIATLLGVNLSAVTSRLHRARLAFKRFWLRAEPRR